MLIGTLENQFTTEDTEGTEERQVRVSGRRSGVNQGFCDAHHKTPLLF
jgi:hypothetical protein